jgi:hypothetical protein
VILFILGLLLSIPLSIIANIYTPTVKNWLAKRSVTRAKSRVDQLTKELDLISLYRQDRGKLQELLLSNILRAIYATSVGGILAATLFLAAQTIQEVQYPYFFIPSTVARFTLSEALVTLGYSVIVLVALLTVRICTTALQTLNRVWSFESYERNTQAILEELRSKASSVNREAEVQ